MNTKVTSDSGKPNKMDNKLLYDHVIHPDIDYFQVYAVDITHLGHKKSTNLRHSLAEKNVN